MTRPSPIRLIILSGPQQRGQTRGSASYICRRNRCQRANCSLVVHNRWMKMVARSTCPETIIKTRWRSVGNATGLTLICSGHYPQAVLQCRPYPRESLCLKIPFSWSGWNAC